MQMVNYWRVNNQSQQLNVLEEIPSHVELLKAIRGKEAHET